MRTFEPGAADHHPNDRNPMFLMPTPSVDASTIYRPNTRRRTPIPRRRPGYLSILVRPEPRVAVAANAVASLSA
ncbi:hypothetical protein GCM10025873_19920 [Demequina sediminis]|nr:hypothetical protein GCM10025873_19920 [Demequina sediminis]